MKRETLGLLAITVGSAALLIGTYSVAGIWGPLISVAIALIWVGRYLAFYEFIPDDTDGDT